MSAEPIIEVKGLRSQFGIHVVHEDLDMTVRRGEVHGIVGGSGSGKSVLVNTILGLRKPDAGEIYFDGQAMSEMSARDRAVLERRWGVLFQGSALFSSLSVRENIMAPLREHIDMPVSLMAEIADLKLGMSGLGPEAATKMPSELSGGMKKRVGIARALALDPDVLFLDEPTAGLDPVGASKFDEMINELRETLGLTVIMITHDVDSLYAICDRISVIAEKKVIVTAPIEELVEFDHPWVQDYFAGPRGRAARSG
jgi:phospholipid/cholesterol/gamma-HCH transport system ATP-binding protein